MAKHPILAGVAALVVVGGIASACNHDSTPAASSTRTSSGAYPSVFDPPSTVHERSPIPPPAGLTVATTPPPAPLPTTTPPPAATTPAGPQLTASQEQAVAKAHDYLAYTHFSRKGLADQLTFDGFTTADAAYGADHSDADWNEQAAGKAKDYLGYTHFSRAGLIAQLKFDGFTTAQATYGTTQAGLR